MTSWEFLGSEVLGSDGTHLHVHFDSAINFSDVQSFAIYVSASLNQSPSFQNADLRIGTGGVMKVGTDYEAYGLIIQNDGQSLLNTSAGETAWRVETSNFGGTFFGLVYLTMNPLTNYPHMVMTIGSDNRQPHVDRHMVMMSCGGFLNSALTSLQDIEIKSGNNFMEESRMYVYKVLNS
tara:strand:+ start:175 stop:711 length:537 start_codon:yes stop_codon:yes gene_type:complete